MIAVRPFGRFPCSMPLIKLRQATRRAEAQRVQEQLTPRLAPEPQGRWEDGGILREVLQRIAPVIRALGYRGSGQNYRKAEGDFVCIINFQGSSSGDRFYVNLGAQPVFIPAEGDADLKKLKEYECVMRRRVGEVWPWQMPERVFASLQTEITAAQAEFFGHAATLRAALAIASVDELLESFSSGTTRARASLHLARAASKLGHVETARKLVERGLELAGDRATILRDELRRVLG